MSSHTPTLKAPGLWAIAVVHLGAVPAVLPGVFPEARPTAGILIAALIVFVVRNVCVSAGFHRYFAHRAFATSRTMQFLLAFVGGMALMRSAVWWASQHRQHHRCSDAPGDPHSPREGMLWAHLLWFTAPGNQPTRHELVRDLEAVPELAWLDRHEWVPVLVFVGGCAALGGFAGWVWVANVATVIQCHAFFSLNSLAHRFGSHPYDTGDDSTNLLPVALLSFGEGWHNNHHYYPQRARLGEGWRQPDVSWWFISVWRRLGLVWDVRS